MNLLTLVEMTAVGMPDRTALGTHNDGLTYRELFDRVATGAEVLRESGVTELLYLGTNGRAFPLALLSAAWMGIPFVPINYRLGDAQLADLLCRHPSGGLITDADALAGPGVRWTPDAWVSRCAATPDAQGPRWNDNPEAVALLLYTSGTTSAPKAAVLRHRHLTSYLLGSVEFGAAEPADAALVSVPPYHIAGVSNLLSNLYAGRRLIHLDQFDPAEWLATVRREEVTNALLVPTMLARIVEELGDSPSEVPTLRNLAYGGSKMPIPVLMRALEFFPETEFVNAYGLTETSSTIAILGPEDHRAACAGDQAALARLASVGKLLPGIEVAIRKDAGTPLGVGQVGEIYVRGPQISGEYRGTEPAVDADGWFATRDRGSVDSEGYLFIEGRADDTIIRGGENIAPAEVEDTLLAHPAVREVAVVGLPDEQWGQEIAAVVVLRHGMSATSTELADWCRARLRSSKTPTQIVFADDLPYTATGKLIRRHVLEGLQSHSSS